MSKAQKKLFGTILRTVGILIMFLSGGCSLVGLFNTSSSEILLVLMFGGIPFLFGLGMFWLGKKIKISSESSQ